MLMIVQLGALLIACSTPTLCRWVDLYFPTLCGLCVYVCVHVRSRARVDVTRVEDIDASGSQVPDGSTCALDCEGVELSFAGELCLVQVALWSPHSPSSLVFLFDIVALGGI